MIITLLVGTSYKSLSVTGARPNIFFYTFTFTRWYTHIIYTCNLHVYDTYVYSIHQLYGIRMCIPLFAPNTSGRDLSFWMISISPPHAALTDVGMGVHKTQIGHSHFQAR